MRKSVIASSNPDHSVQFYEDDAFLCEEVGAFFGKGFDGDEAAVIIASERHLRGVAAALDAAGYDLAGLRASGQFLELDAEETLARIVPGSSRYGLPDEGSFQRLMGGIVAGRCRDSRFCGLRVYGEMVNVLTAHGNAPATVRLEELWNDLRATHPFRLFCGYSMSHFRRAEELEAFRTICALHEHVLPTESYDDRSSLEAQRRHITELQQRAGALEVEISERKKLERALREEQTRLREANRRKDDFIALLSHELRNPLAPILTSLDLMDARGDSASRREREIIRRQARHLTNLVEHILDMSRAATGTMSLDRRRMEFAAVADAALEMTGPLFQERGHVLDLDVPSEGLLMDADPARMPQVIANLLANAAKFTPARGRVTLRARREGAEIVVTVEDDGIGIAPERLDEIFSPFTQGHQGLDRADGGLGLGLTLVRSLTELHGGSASAHSDGLGKGSRFTLRLPAAHRERTRRPRQGNATRSRRVLVVDENRESAAAISSLVRQLGFDVRTAHEAEEAVVIAASFAPYTALVDVGLPDLDGYSLATRLRRMQDGVPLNLIAITGLGHGADREKSVLAGFDGHLVKPLNLEILRALLESFPAPVPDPIAR